jgi:hypothetical protein
MTFHNFEYGYMPMFWIGPSVIPSARIQLVVGVWFLQPYFRDTRSSGVSDFAVGEVTGLALLRIFHMPESQSLEEQL